MTQKITANINPPIYEYPSMEYLAKLNNAERQSTLEAYKKANDSRERAYTELNKLKGTENSGLIAEKQKEINDNIKLSNEQTYSIPTINIGKNGVVSSAHKNKLAFVFIGDVKKAEEDSSGDVNAPKISMIVGGGLEGKNHPETGLPMSVDPRKDEIIGISAQLHLVSLSDINVEGILPISTLKNRSAIKAKADVLEFSASEAVFIRSLGEAYGSKGQRVLSPGGVHIVSGQNVDTKKITEPEPMVLGKKLSDTLVEIVDKISELNSTIISMNDDILFLKVALLAHGHPALFTPSPDLALQVAPSLATKTLINLTNSYTNLINLEMIKMNRLTALSTGKFVSEFNRVN